MNWDQTVEFLSGVIFRHYIVTFLHIGYRLMLSFIKSNIGKLQMQRKAQDLLPSGMLAVRCHWITST